MFNVLGYGQISPYTYAIGCSKEAMGMNYYPGIFEYLLTYRLPQYRTVTPTSKEQIIVAQGLNRYLEQVTVKAIPTTTTTTN